MPPPFVGRFARATVIALLLAIGGVLVLDTTALVAAPQEQTVPSADVASEHQDTGLRLLSWSHQTWLVFPVSANGPEGPRTLSDSRQAASVDTKGRLHLRLTKNSTGWKGVQLESLSPLGYGTYRFVTASRIARLARPAVLGMFVFKSTGVAYTQEIDLEDSRALGMRHHHDAQYVVQPYWKHHHRHTYAIPKRYKFVMHQFTWRPGTVTFVTRAGRQGHGPVLGHFTFKGYDVPQPGNEHLYINLHLHPDHPPGKGLRGVVLDSFRMSSG